mmetsp:Transcript_67583/g.133381  ORF Transcript_67583/g.133381 Transcript_67583/m.133381 type:complete len:221 (+) Transcript_67583:80-742(+)
MACTRMAALAAAGLLLMSIAPAGANRDDELHEVGEGNKEVKEHRQSDSAGGVQACNYDLLPIVRATVAEMMKSSACPLGESFLSVCYDYNTAAPGTCPSKSEPVYRPSGSINPAYSDCCFKCFQEFAGKEVPEVAGPLNIKWEKDIHYDSALPSNGMGTLMLGNNHVWKALVTGMWRLLADKNSNNGFTKDGCLGGVTSTSPNLASFKKILQTAAAVKGM